MEKTADGFFQKGDYAQAAAMYENALKKRTTKHCPSRLANRIISCAISAKQPRLMNP
jgi:hypothetical protein